MPKDLFEWERNLISRINLFIISKKSLLLSKKNHKPPMKWEGGGKWKRQVEETEEKKRENEIQRSEIKERRKGGRERRRIAKRRKRKEKKEGRKEGRVGVKETKRKSECKKGSQRVGQFSLKISRRRGASWKRELERQREKEILDER